MTEPELTQAASPPDTSSRGWSIFLAIFAGIVYIAIGFAFVGSSNPAITIGKWAWRLFPIVQYAYIWPLYKSDQSRGRFKSAQGWLIGSAIAALICSPCWGLAWMF